MSADSLAITVVNIYINSWESWDEVAAKLPSQKANVIEGALVQLLTDWIEGGHEAREGQLARRKVREHTVKGPGTNAQPERARDLARGAYLFRVTEDILVAMEDQGVSKAELAQRLGKSKARISQLLGGSSNMTIGTLADIAFALGLTPDKTFKEYSQGRYWVTEEERPVKRRVAARRNGFAKARNS